MTKLLRNDRLGLIFAGGTIIGAAVYMLLRYA
jgi:hypothetical protein